ncbi:MAG: argininosuccinate lyase [Candidatus Hodarchaeaceae archaeon]|nr:argininosuccinate lyase [Candidatus Hodarchaeaceae archaeon]
MLRRGRLKPPTDEMISEYTSSMRADVRIFKPVVQINMAHIIMLAERRIIPEEDAAAILRALHELHERGVEALELRPELEDIHMAVEKFVIAATDEEVGGKLHTAKSRNDQVAAAIRMTLRKDLLEVQAALLELIGNLIALAEKNTRTIMPGYTHLQVAEPTTFAHYLVAHASAFLRDADRLSHALEQASSCPMGACALAGTSFPIDRMRVARLLGFKHILENTIDAVGGRDFALQTISALAISMVNVSRLADELVLWGSAEFDMIEMPDEFAATSSIMPQKKNPVVAEIARAKAGRLTGNLVGALAVMKALPQSYNLDLQDLTPLLWDAIDQTRDSLKAMSKLMGAIEPKPEVMRERAEMSFATATELADTLVRRAGLAFRDAHAVVGRMVARAVKEHKSPRALSIEDLQAACREILGKGISLTEKEFKEAWDAEKCVEARGTLGGPAPKVIKGQINQLRRAVKNREKLVRARARAIAKAETKLLKDVRRRVR